MKTLLEQAMGHKSKDRRKSKWVGSKEGYDLLLAYLTGDVSTRAIVTTISNEEVTATGNRFYPWAVVQIKWAYKNGYLKTEL